MHMKFSFVRIVQKSFFKIIQILISISILGNLMFFLQNLQIYEYVNTVNFEKMTVLIPKCLQHITSDDKCATKQHIDVQFLK